MTMQAMSESTGSLICRSLGRPGCSEDFERIDATEKITPSANAPCPCDGCEHRRFCASRGAECAAFKSYISVKGSVIYWEDSDRNPFGDKRSVSRKDNRAKPKTFHNGHPFVRGSTSERLYLLLQESGPHTNRDLQRLLREQGIKFTLEMISALMHQLKGRGVTERVDNYWVAR